MKIQLRAMITTPEPSARPEATLFLALLAAACLAASVAALISGVVDHG